MEKYGIIELEEMRFWAYHGCLEREKKEGNLFIVNFKGEVDMSKAVETDRLDDAVNYADIYNVIKAEMAIHSDLLEHVAGRIVKAIETAFPEFRSFTVSIAKRRPPLDGPVQWSRITLSSGK